MIYTNKISQIVFIGAGKMAEAIFSRLISTGKLTANNITVSDISEERLSFLKSAYKINISTSNIDVLNVNGPIIISVKPQQIREVLEQISDSVGNRLVISIAAGVKTNLIKKYLPLARIIRVMPNTAALVGKAISAISKGNKADSNDVKTAKLIFGSIGKVIEVEENLQNAVTAVSGSGPAYFFYLTELLSKAGVTVGLNKDQSYQLASETAIGASELLKTGKQAKELRKAVTSPQGTTQAALESFVENNLRKTVEIAVQKAYKRAEELSKN